MSRSDLLAAFEPKTLWASEPDGRGGLRLIVNNGHMTHADERRWHRFQESQREFYPKRRRRMGGK